METIISFIPDFLLPYKDFMGSVAFYVTLAITLILEIIFLGVLLDKLWAYATCVSEYKKETSEERRQYLIDQYVQPTFKQVKDYGFAGHITKRPALILLVDFPLVALIFPLVIKYLYRWIMSIDFLKMMKQIITTFTIDDLDKKLK